MKTNYLIPHRYKIISGILFAVALVLYIALYTLDAHTSVGFKADVFAIVGDDGFMSDTVTIGLISNYIADEILMTFILTCGLAFAFSKEKYEDEMVASIRLNSLAWATIANYLILLFCYLFIYGLPFLNILMATMLSQLFIFIVLFRYKMYRFNTRQDEE